MLLMEIKDLLLFYRDPAKSVAYTTNVTTNGTAGSGGAYVQITIDKDTPNTLYYQCGAHAYMGHVIEVVGSRDFSSGTAVGDGTTVGFTINSGRTVDDMLVFVNGICLVPTTDYTISGTTLTFVTAPASSAEITFRYLG